jgi:hypothetical protein
MEYDSSMTLNENILVLEQNPNAKYLDPNYTNRNPNARVGTAGSDYFAGVQMKQNKFIKNKEFCQKNPDKCHVIEGTTVKEIVNSLRDFFFESYIGFATDIVISVAGAEVGGPIIMKALEFAFLANDLDTYYSNTNESYRKRPFLEKFLDQSNKSFNNVIVDLFVIGTAGAIKGAGATKKYLKSAPGKLAEIATKSKGLIEPVKGILSKIPKIGEWLSGKLNMLSEFFTSLIPKAKAAPEVATKVATTAVKELPAKFSKYLDKIMVTVPKNFTKAALQAFIGMMIMKVGEETMGYLLERPSVQKNIAKLAPTNPPKETIWQFADKETEDAILEDNPNLKSPVKIIDSLNSIYGIGNPMVKYKLDRDNAMQVIKI